MTLKDIARLGKLLAQFLIRFSDCFTRPAGWVLLGAYVRGLLTDVQRNNAEAIALNQNVAPRTLQRFLESMVWVSAIQRHMPPVPRGPANCRPDCGRHPRSSRSSAGRPPAVPGHSPARPGGASSRSARRIALAVSRSCRSSWRYTRIASGWFLAQTSGARDS